MSHPASPSFGLVVSVLGLLVGCALTPIDRQFRCLDLRCPSGLTCVDGLCRTSLDGTVPLDAERSDIGPSDARPSDAPDGADGPPPDVPPGDEVCEPGPSGPVDEDVDGMIDETCEYRVGVPHAPIGLHRAYSWHYGAELTRGGRRLWFTTHLTGLLSSADRPNLESRFGPPTHRTVPGLPGGTLIVLSSITDDETEAFVQVVGPPAVNAIYRLVLASGAVTSAEPVSAGGVDLNTAFGEVAEPTIRRDGLALAFRVVLGSRIMETVRSGPGGTFGTPRDVIVGNLPSYGPGGVLFVSTRDGPRVLSPDRTLRTATPFGDRPFYFPPTREVFFAGNLASSPSGVTAGIMRAEVCRSSSGCGAVPACPGTLAGTPDGAHCFFTQPVTQLDAMCRPPDGIGPADRVFAASLHLASEQSLVAGIVGNVGLGLFRNGAGFDWRSGEPVIYTNWAAGEPMGGTNDCVLRDAAGTWRTVDCTAAGTLLCELDRWPLWAPDGG